MPLLLFVCAVGGGLWYYIREELQILHPRDGVGDISVLDVPSRFPLALDDVVALLDEVLEEHLCRYGDHESGIVRAVADVVVGCDDLLHSCHYITVSGCHSQIGCHNLRGNDTVPVISVEGAIGVLL